MSNSGYSEILMFLNFFIDIGKYCGQAPKINNGYASANGAVFGSTATYTCNENYALTGNQTIICQSNSTWQPPPICSGKYMIRLVDTLIQCLMHCLGTLVKYLIHLLDKLVKNAYSPL